METVFAVVTSWWGIGIGVVALGSVGVVVWRWVLADLVLASIELP
jgi:hypothetical protein